mgnify:CR=1 FL=1
MYICIVRVKIMETPSKAEIFFETTEGDKLSSLPAFASEPLSAIETHTLIHDNKSITFPSYKNYT